MNFEVKTGDTVLVIAGKDKGKTGKITASNREKGRVVVEGVNIVHKHRKPRSQKDRGGIKKEEASIDVSNVQIICPTCGKATRIAQAFDDKGNKHRVCKKCGAKLDSDKKVKAAKKEAKAEKVEKEEKPATKTAKTTKVEKEAKAPAKKETESKAKTTTKSTAKKSPAKTADK